MSKEKEKQKSHITGNATTKVSQHLHIQPNQPSNTLITQRPFFLASIDRSDHMAYALFVVVSLKRDAKSRAHN